MNRKSENSKKKKDKFMMIFTKTINLINSKDRNFIILFFRTGLGIKSTRLIVYHNLYYL